MSIVPEERPTAAQIKESELPGWAKDIQKLRALVYPTEDRVVILPDMEKTISNKTGLIMTSSAKGRIEPWGTVIGVGPGKQSEYSDFFIKPWVQLGARVNYAKFAGDDYFLDEEGSWEEWANVGRTPTGKILIKVVRQSAILQMKPVS